MVGKEKFVLGLLVSVLAVSFAVGKIGTGSENLAPSLLESKEQRTAGADSKGENSGKKETSGLARVLDNSSSSGTKETSGASEGLTNSSSLGTKETSKQANPTEVSGGLGGVGTSGSTGIRETSGTTGTAENLGFYSNKRNFWIFLLFREYGHKGNLRNKWRESVISCQCERILRRH
jgi:hypothetical protein